MLTTIKSKLSILYAQLLSLCSQLWTSTIACGGIAGDGDRRHGNRYDVFNYFGGIDCYIRNDCCNRTTASSDKGQASNSAKRYGYRR